MAARSRFAEKYDLNAVRLTSEGTTVGEPPTTIATVDPP
jgi:hypothetical protein